MSEFTLYLCKTITRPCMKYCCRIRTGVPSCYLELLDQLQKRTCRIVSPSLAVSLESLTHCQNVASVSLFWSELVELVLLPYSRGTPTRYSDILDDVYVAIPRFYKDVYVNSFSPRTSRPWNSLPIECFPLSYDLSGFKYGINRHVLTVGSF